MYLIELSVALLLLIIAALLLFYKPRTKKKELFNRSSAYNELNQITYEKFDENKDSSLFFTWEFFLKRNAIKAESEFIKKGYETFLVRENWKIVWELTVCVKIEYQVEYLIETEKTLNDIAKKYKGIYAGNGCCGNPIDD